MAANLVVVESPAKAKTINKILGRDYVVESSNGHIRDLPVRTLGVDVDKNFEPKYVLIKGRGKMVEKLKKAARASQKIFLAPDPDREGEAIAWHLAALLSKANPEAEILRVQYNEITPEAVRRAFEQTGAIDMNRVNAQQARRVLDRLVGYMVSPMLWRRVRRGLSAGRVQSVALRLVCEREREIDAFVSEAFWVHGARVRKTMAPLDPFRIRLTRIDGDKAQVGTEEASRSILSDLEGRTLKVTDVVSKDVRKRPPPPYITSTLQQAGSGFCGFSPKRTMMLAQSLYEGVDFGQGPVGLITYMRTDSVHLAEGAVAACRAFISDTFGAAYLPEAPNRYRSRAGAQEAHEAIRPTDVTLTPELMKGKIDPAMLKLYTVIWRRFVACQMAPAVLRQRTVVIDAVKPAAEARAFTFQGTSSDIVFPGYMKATGADQKKKDETAEDERLPDLTIGEALVCLEWLAERKETQPPPRFSETSLVGALERHGIGRPGTYAQTISTLVDRKYANREQRTLTPTDLGLRVNDLLVESLGELFDVRFTAGMEEQLDAVESGRVEWTGMLSSFYEKFEQWLARTRSAPAADADVERVLALFAAVHSWAAPVQRGRRTYSDEGFVASIRQRLEEPDGEVSRRQLETLIQLACKYDDQIGDTEARLTEMGFGEQVRKAQAARPLETTVRKLDMLADIGVDDSGRHFVDSVRKQVASGRALSEAQRRVLDQIVAGVLRTREDGAALAAAVGVTLEVADDEESGALLNALAGIAEWKPPIQRGKRTFDDRTFYASLKDYYEKKRFLSQRQKAALKRMLARYKDQVADYAGLRERYDLGGRAQSEE